LRYSPNVRRLMGWPGSGSAPDFVRLGMHNSFNTLHMGFAVILRDLDWFLAWQMAFPRAN